MKNSISFSLRGRYALFTDPLTKTGGEKFSYQIPTYEALKGVVKSIYWKPTLIWYIDRVRVMNSIRTQSKGVKPLNWGGGNDLAYYTFLHDVHYQVEAHFEWNLQRPELEADRIDGKHHSIATRALSKGGRQDIFLGVRDCQGYVEPCDFGSGEGAYDGLDQLDFGLMFHSFGYPDETGEDVLISNLSRPVMKHGVITFERPEQCHYRDNVRKMTAKVFTLNQSLEPVDRTEASI